MNEHLAEIGHNNLPQLVCLPWLAGAEAHCPS